MRYTKKQGAVVAGTTLLMIADALVHSSAGYFVAPVTEALGISRFAFMVYYTILQIIGILVIPAFSRLILRVKAKHILLVCAAWGALGLLWFGACRSVWMFYLAATFLGIAAAGCTSLIGVSILEDWFGERSGMPIGITMTGTGIGGILLGLLLPNLLGRFGWSAGYYLMAVCWALLLGAAAFLTDGAPEREKKQAAAKIMVPWSLPLIGLMAALFILALHGIFLQHMQAHFVQQGLSDARAGVMMSLFNAFVILFKIIQGMMFDRLGVMKTVCVTMMLFAMGFPLLLSTAPTGLFAGMTLMAFGMSSITILMPLATRYLLGPAQYSVAYGRVLIAHNIGAACGSPIWGAVHDYTGSYHIGLAVAPVLLIVDLACLVLLMRTRRLIPDGKGYDV